MLLQVHRCLHKHAPPYLNNRTQTLVTAVQGEQTPPQKTIETQLNFTDPLLLTLFLIKFIATTTTFIYGAIDDLYQKAFKNRNFFLIVMDYLVILLFY